MNVVHSAAWYLPESTGGTEIYVSGLADELKALGVHCTIAVPANGMPSADYVHQGIDVHRYPYCDTADLAISRNERPHPNFEAFAAWLKRQPHGIYHQHSWTTSCGLAHLSAAKALGFRTVLTVHVPGNICLRGTMMEFGSDPCDGRVEAVRCGTCWSHGRGLPRTAAEAVGRFPGVLSRAAYRSGAQSRIATALAARALAAARRQQIAAMAAAADRIVAVCGWLADALRLNGVDDEKLAVNRQGVGRDFVGRQATRVHRGHGFRLGFLGRSDPVKGLAVLLGAMALLPRDLPVELVIHALANSEEERQVREHLIAASADDARIKFMPPVGRAELGTVLAGFNLLAVPSQWQETGPLVVLEAQAAGVPVLGSNLGGIAELITPGVDGELVEFADQAAWAKAIHDAVRGALPCLRQPMMPRSVRTMADAAQEMAALYAGIRN